MIGKISANPKAISLIDYITAKNKYGKKSTLLLHSDGLLCTDNKTMAACLEAYALKGDHDLAKPFKHISLSFHAKDSARMTDEFMEQVARDYMEEMGIKDTEFVVFRHHDKAYPHCHLAFSRVNKFGHVISDGKERQRNMNVCKHLSLKYDLHMSEGKETVNKDKLNGKDLLRYEMFEKVQEAKENSTDWQEFKDQLEVLGIKLNFRYNNISGQLMGISFSDGKHSFSGKKLDNSLVYSKLVEEFGDLKELAHESVRDYYENERSRLLYWNDWSSENKARINSAFPDFDSIFPDGADSVPKPSIKHLLGFSSNDIHDYCDYSLQDFIPSTDGQNGFVSLDLLVAVLLQPYQPQLSQCGGGGGGNERGWRDKDDDWERFKFRFNKPRQQSRTKSRGR